jgi:DNA-binding winged helix-turn-helix (wHTH) protein
MSGLGRPVEKLVQIGPCPRERTPARQHAANEDEARIDGASGYSFGQFRLLPGRRLLLEGGTRIRLGSRALDILFALVERAGRLVPKQELIARTWPNIFVDESNLKIQVSALRRALGDGQAGNRYIVTTPGRGYSFVAPVSREERPLDFRCRTAGAGAAHSGCWPAAARSRERNS